MVRAAELELLKSSLPRIEAFRSCDHFTLSNQNLKSNGYHENHDESSLHVNQLDYYVAEESAPTITLIIDGESHVAGIRNRNFPTHTLCLAARGPFP